jgi:peptidoglycan/LPS O-acetylase OafA/YrhL
MSTIAPPTTTTRSLSSFLFRPDKPGVRPEVQALRAFAVLAVVFYHLWPDWTTGGYAGVDVFFVISGFLITSHLFREVARTGRIKLGQFWARRARRLLPASFLVIAASAIGTAIFVPQSLWQQFFREFGASALYVINWVLAGDAVDYLGAENTPSPVQHYWSLAAEEQFYLIWPLLMLLGIFIASRTSAKNRRVATFVVLAVVTAASLTYSIVLTSVDPAAAYFITPVRAWEFGFGALLAIATAPAQSTDSATVAPRFVKLRAAVSWVGFAMLFATVLLYTPATPFPGWTALLPAVGTVAVIWAGSPAVFWAPTMALRLRPIQWTGDISYSLYLWHWPLVVIVSFIMNGHKHLAVSFAMLAASFVLAALTKKFVEDPVRTSRFLTTRPSALTFSFMAGAMAIVVAVSAFTWNNLEVAYQGSIITSQNLAANHTECFGAAAFAPENQPCVDPSLDGVLVPLPGSGESDRVIRKGCRVSTADGSFLKCTIVKAGTGRPKVVLIGDSHAEHWVPAVQEIAKARGWKLDTLLKGGCTYGSAVRSDQPASTTATCTSWTKRVLKTLKESNYDLIIVSASAEKEFNGGFDAAVAGLVDQWTRTEKATGVPLVAIKDPPLMSFRAPDCLTALGDQMVAKAEEKCSTPRDKALIPDPQVKAAKKAHIPLIDLTDYFCKADRCYSTIGSVVVYRDAGHIGGTFSKTLAPYLAKQLDAMVGTIG